MIHTPRYVLASQPRAARVERTGVLVIGAGAAGLSAALVAAERADVTILVRGRLPESNSALAQGGIAAALNDDDSPRSHIDDTLIAGAGLSDRGAVSALAYDAPDLMRELATLGVPFERDGDDHFALGLEGGHSQRRIVHVGDATGWAVIRQLIAQAQAHPRIRIREGWQAVDLLDAGGRVVGALARDDSGAWSRILADATILATGGAGALYGLTSNQPVALGEGIAMAYRAGAEIADMEFIQFHPTVYRTRAGQGFLITEAARGEGGILRTLEGERFMPAYDPRAELAPRDVVTRGIYAAMRRTGSDHVLLDLTHLPAELLAHHFPTISARLREDGIDIATTPIPVAPASHYLMGGVRTDLHGATSLPGLYAAGEVSCTGVHGANRLASNSLLECLVFGRRAGVAAARQMQNAKCKMQNADAAEPEPAQLASESPFCILHFALDWRADLAEIMVSAAGPLRDGRGLRVGQAALAAMPIQASPDDGEAITAANAALTARLIVESALLREESRGGHFRSDFPQTREDWHAHTVLRRGLAHQLVGTVAPGLSHAAD
jgi:L-aspartate oxidase